MRLLLFPQDLHAYKCQSYTFMLDAYIIYWLAFKSNRRAYYFYLIIIKIISDSEFYLIVTLKLFEELTQLHLISHSIFLFFQSLLLTLQQS